MLSLDNVFSRRSSTRGPARVERAVGTDVAYACEQKIDGVACALTYERGVLVQAATRGDGVHGRGHHGERADGARRPRRGSS